MASPETKPSRFCDQCGRSLVPLNGPHVQRKCRDCGKIIHVAEPGEGGQGIKVEEGDSFVIPAGSLTLSLDLAQSSGRFFRPGITWFLKQLYFQGSSNTPDEVESMLASYAREAEMVLEHSPHLKHLNLNDENDFKKAIDIIKKDEGELAEWWAILVHHGTAMVREALAENDTPRAVWAMNKIACYRSMFIFKQNLEEHVWRGYLANQIIYNAASAAAHTPAEAEAINKLKPLFSKMEESVLHTWVKSGLPIGPRIGVKDLPEEMLKALAEWHLSVFQRQIDEDKWNQETRIKLRQNWYQGLTVGMTIIGGLGAVAWTVVQILKAFGKLQSKL